MVNRVRLQQKNTPRNTPSKIKFTEGQNSCIDFILENIEKATAFSIRGNAGVGKSTVFAELAKVLRSQGKRVKTCALTHKAASLLTKKIPNTGTVHSLFGLRPEIDYRTGMETYKPIGTPKIEYGDIVNVDESSMTGNDLFALLTGYILTQSLRFAFFGDQFQLPPVGEELSPALFLENSFDLTEVVRHDSEILELSTACCDAVKQKSFVSLTRFVNGKNIHYLRKGEFNERMKQDMLVGYTKGGVQDTDFAKLVAWTNRTVEDAALEIRGWLGRGEVPEAHEVLTVTSPYEKHGIQLYQNNEEVTLSLVKEDVLSVAGQDLHGVYCTTTKYPGQQHFAPTDKKAVQKLLRSIGQECEKTRHWGKYFEVKNKLLYLAYPQSSTAHKAQGSTYNNVYINLPDMRACTDLDLYSRLLYVAVSRASDNVYLLK